MMDKMRQDFINKQDMKEQPLIVPLILMQLFAIKVLFLIANVNYEENSI